VLRRGNFSDTPRPGHIVMRFTILLSHVRVDNKLESATIGPRADEGVRPTFS
jgi:hypothetical protein